MTLTGSLQWGGTVGTSQLCSTFNYNWVTGNVFQSYATYIGFEATMTVKMQRNGPVTFTIGADDGDELYLDGSVLINDFTSHSYRTQTTTINLSQGTHTLTLWYFQVTGTAQVSFTCDSDILQWSS